MTFYKADTDIIDGPAVFRILSGTIDVATPSKSVALSVSRLLTDAQNWTTLVTTTKGKEKCVCEVEKEQVGFAEERKFKS